MPEQPDDPLHYEMKIPPEPKKTEHQQKTDEPAVDDKAQKSDTAKDNCDDAKPESGRKTG